MIEPRPVFMRPGEQLWLPREASTQHLEDAPTGGDKVEFHAGSCFDQSGDAEAGGCALLQQAGNGGAREIAVDVTATESQPMERVLGQRAGAGRSTTARSTWRGFTWARPLRASADVD